jgi:hypothetical protein
MGNLALAPVDGCIGVASIKSTLDKKELEDCLEGFAKGIAPHRGGAAAVTAIDRTFDNQLGKP